MTTAQAQDRRLSKLERQTGNGGQFHVLLADSDNFDADAALAERGIEPEPDDHVFVVRFVSPKGRIEPRPPAESAEDAVEKVQPSYPRSFLLQ